MADDKDEITEDDVSKIVPDFVRQAYADEVAFIVARVEAHNKDSWIQRGMTFVPFVDEVFEETPIDVSSATSDVPREGRIQIVVKKIEAGLGFALDEETKKEIRSDIFSLYNSTLEELKGE